GPVPPKTAGKPSAHLTLRPQNLAQDGNSRRFGNPSQSCAGKYSVSSQISFRYPSDGASARVSVPQLVQCINWKTSYSQPILLLKGVGTKCWAPEADYGLHALYQG
ncbi:PREDICTED: tumor necrosis factor ligand superfamily member 10-like, partial [Fulmarus glacialis]|uniref:tumor necrosis factor ligand superfamily member 10-like n=1 Tax=Fulmarus glacialis TaxID=30455 RepID=UPI00051C87FE